MIKSFYKYAKNRYLRDNLNNFVCEECINVIQDGMLYVSIH